MRVCVVYLFLNSFPFYQAIRLLSRRLSINICICLCICTDRFTVCHLCRFKTFLLIASYSAFSRKTVNKYLYLYLYQMMHLRMHLCNRTYIHMCRGQRQHVQRVNKKDKGKTCHTPQRSVGTVLISLP